ncbi:NADH-quinone oxidoreductase subunit A [Candidatus Sumerlaeota bacterium]|nr:NADH-quinone oxidoreductase subunit A [Candidatus Sumerlaeota bacterium]
MLFHFAAVLVFLLVSVVFIFGNLILGWFIRPTRPGAEKNLIYECGEPSIGTSWIRYNIRFYTIALVYLIFDVEVVFLFPIALVMKNMGALALVETLTFVAVLAIGLVYAWRYGNLNWITAVEDETETKGSAEVKELSLGV